MSRNRNYRDPNYYLDKAEYFYEMAQLDDRMDGGDETDETDEGDMADEIKPREVLQIKEISAPKPRVRIVEGRIYDPIKKHYFKLDNPPPKAPKIPKSGVWYPENKLSSKTMHDPSTGRYYQITKLYDDDGNFSYVYDRLEYRPVKRPGENFYLPNYVALVQ